jgi:copper chaperone CopZ
MNTLKFKTNINCGGCIAKVSPVLDSTVGKGKWQVDTSDPKKILTVETDTLSRIDIEEAIKDLGFKIMTE